MDATLPAVAEELLKEIEKVFHEMSHGHLSIVTNCPQSRWEKRDRQFVTVAQETELQKSLPEAGSDITRAEDHRVPDDHLRALKFIFGASAIQALDLVDCQAVTRIVSPSGRTVYQVLGSSRKLYRCYASCHFCPCPAFAFSVLRKGDNLLCKHLLAIYLSQAMGTCQELTMPDKQLTRLLLPDEEEGG